MMQTPNEFWLCLHELSRAIDAEGRSDDQRRLNIAFSLEKMPPMARSQVLAELADLLAFLPDPYTQVAGPVVDCQGHAGSRGVA